MLSFHKFLLYYHFISISEYNAYRLFPKYSTLSYSIFNDFNRYNLLHQNKQTPWQLAEEDMDLMQQMARLISSAKWLTRKSSLWKKSTTRWNLMMVEAIQKNLSQLIHNRLTNRNRAHLKKNFGKTLTKTERNSNNSCEHYIKYTNRWFPQIQY